MGSRFLCASSTVLTLSSVVREPRFNSHGEVTLFSHAFHSHGEVALLIASYEEAKALYIVSSEQFTLITTTKILFPPAFKTIDQSIVPFSLSLLQRNRAKLMANRAGNLTVFRGWGARAGKVLGNECGRRDVKSEK